MKGEISFSILLAFILFVGINIANNYSYSEEVEKQQLIIKDKIKSYDSYGLEYKSDYVNTFTPPKAFDNQLITELVKNSGWSQRGDSGFIVNLDAPLDKQICSAEIIPLTPKNSPFLLTLGNKSVEGKIDSTSVTVNFLPNCVKDVSQIKFDVKSPVDVRNPIQEIKLFTQKTIPPIDPPTCPPDSYWDDKLKQCVKIDNHINGTTITNSTIALKVSNSTITIVTDATTKVIDKTTPIGTPLNENEEEEEEEQDKDKEKDKSK